ncbi:uncharacterized protein LOC135806369 [Sycon ciliatum]|uniref:uncharacterized protein LOC135806369 n=1 Tax=Sycon ciliatum TaxID=27933 RepID=UPI0020A99342|eukprot:scpid26045/ scgid18513/ Nuclear polyadenylated RNA-binding protein 4; Cleavage factor IB
MSQGYGGGPGGNEPEQERKMFIGGLSRDTTEESMRQFYSGFGPIADLFISRDPQTQMSKCFGFVTFEHSTCVDEALSKLPHVLDGKRVDAKVAKPKDQMGGGGGGGGGGRGYGGGSNGGSEDVSTKKCFVGGIPLHVEGAQLREIMSEHGPVEDVEMMLDRETNRSRGFAFVSFCDLETVDKLCSQQYVDVLGKKVEVKRALPRGGTGGGGRGGFRGGGRGGGDRGGFRGRGRGFGGRGGGRGGFGGGGYNNSYGGGRGGGNGGRDNYSGGAYGGAGGYGGSYGQGGYGSYGGSTAYPSAYGAQAGQQSQYGQQSYGAGGSAAYGAAGYGSGYGANAAYAGTGAQQAGYAGQSGYGAAAAAAAASSAAYGQAAGASGYGGSAAGYAAPADATSAATYGASFGGSYQQQPTNYSAQRPTGAYGGSGHSFTPY